MYIHQIKGTAKATKLLLLLLLLTLYLKLEKFTQLCKKINSLTYSLNLQSKFVSTKFAVIGSNLVTAYEETKMFALLPQLYPRDFVDFFIRNYFRFLYDTIHK